MNTPAIPGLPELTPRQKYEILVAYTVLKLSERDWHGLMDSSADIREILAKHPELEK